jgi:alkylation response protein AidB-like acyl-CoA dehydrogenase
VFNYTAVARLDKGEYVVKEATMAKLQSTKRYPMKQFIVAYKCWELYYMEEYPLARLFRDSLGPIGGGTSEILKEISKNIDKKKTKYKPAVK